MASRRKRKSSSNVWTALASAGLLAGCLATPLLHSQDKKPYQAGTIVDVKPHQAAQANSDTTKPKDGETEQFDISIRVGRKIYVVLYTPPTGQNYPELGLGMDRTVLVDGDTMKVNDLLGRTRTMPILSTKDTPPKATN